MTKAAAAKITAFFDGLSEEEAERLLLRLRRYTLTWPRTVTPAEDGVVYSKREYSTAELAITEAHQVALAGREKARQRWEELFLQLGRAQGAELERLQGEVEAARAALEDASELEVRSRPHNAGRPRPVARSFR
jgi:hypothetical protein